MNFLDDLATWIASSSSGFDQIGSGVSSGYAVYKLNQPPSTGNMVILYAYGGVAPVAMRDGTVDNPRLNVRTVSSATSDLGYQAALTIQNRLRYVANRTIPTTTGAYFWFIEPLQSPEPLGFDLNGRYVWIQNFQTQFSYSA